MKLVHLLAQAAPEAGSGGPSTIQIVAGVLAIAIVVIIIVRRKGKQSKDDWS